MNPATRANQPQYGLLPTHVEGFEPLAELALDMRWSWNHATDQIWRQLAPELWEITHNPWVVLQTVSRDQIERVWDDPGQLPVTPLRQANGEWLRTSSVLTCQRMVGSGWSLHVQHCQHLM